MYNYVYWDIGKHLYFPSIDNRPIVIWFFSLIFFDRFIFIEKKKNWLLKRIGGHFLSALVVEKNSAKRKTKKNIEGVENQGKVIQIEMDRVCIFCKKILILWFFFSLLDD